MFSACTALVLRLFDACSAPVLLLYGACSALVQRTILVGEKVGDRDRIAGAIVVTDET